MNEKSANARRVALRIEHGVFGLARGVAAIKGFAFAPTTATDDGIFAFDDKIGAIANEQSIDAEYWTERGLDLCGGIVRSLQDTGGKANEYFQGRRVLIYR